MTPASEAARNKVINLLCGYQEVMPDSVVDSLVELVLQSSCSMRKRCGEGVKKAKEIAELRETLNDYETVVADMYESKIASLSQKLEKYEASMKSCANPEAHWEFLSPKKSEEGA